MYTNELNNFIKHYLDADNTHSAIMLTAPWGTGKSHYIKNELIPFIDSDDQRKCIMVSLYGLKELHEISKNIYLEVRAKAITKKSEPLHAGKIIGKTIIKGVASFFGVNLDISQDDLVKLYESIDLTGKLIILEDLERSQIDILEILGYVNNLVEQDGVKVLLVANEGEIFAYEEKEVIDNTSKENAKKTIKVLTTTSQRYLEVKEKTIGDTIYFRGHTRNAIKNILASFANPIITALTKESDILNECKLASEIYEEIMQNDNINSKNLRALIYACQKTADIFDSVNNQLDLVFAKNILMSIIAFCLRKKQNDNISWGNNKFSYSSDLGTYKYPLLHYCYLNICFQYNYPKELTSAEKDYLEQKELNEQQALLKANLDTIYNFYECNESEVIQALKSVKNSLLDASSINPVQYGKLSNYLIALKDAIGCEKDINECKQLMLKHLSKVKEDIVDRISFHDSFELEGTAKTEFNDFKQEMLAVLKQQPKEPFDFNYSSEQLSDFCEQIYKNRDKFILSRTFARKFDNNKLIDFLKACTSTGIADIRGLFHTIYSFSNIDEYFMEEKDTLIDLKQKVENLVNANAKFDKIKILQLKWFIRNLENIIDRLQGHD